MQFVLNFMHLFNHQKALWRLVFLLHHFKVFAIGTYRRYCMFLAAEEKNLKPLNVNNTVPPKVLTQHINCQLFIAVVHVIKPLNPSVVPHTWFLIHSNLE